MAAEAASIRCLCRFCEGCDCAYFRNGCHPRQSIYIDIQSAVLQPESFRTTATYLLCNGIFNLRNRKSGSCQRCSMKWITSDNVQDDEIEFMRYYLPLFAEGFIAMPELSYEYCTQIMLSGLVLFRTELLPIFREKMSDDIDLAPLILRVLYWEGVIRNYLSGKPEKYDYYRCFINKHLSEDLKRNHKWWNSEFIDSEDLNATEEYSLTD